MDGFRGLPWEIGPGEPIEGGGQGVLAILGEKDRERPREWIEGPGSP